MELNGRLAAPTDHFYAQGRKRLSPRIHSRGGRKYLSKINVKVPLS